MASRDLLTEEPKPMVTLRLKMRGVPRAPVIVNRPVSITNVILKTVHPWWQNPVA